MVTRGQFKLHWSNADAERRYHDLMTLVDEMQRQFTEEIKPLIDEASDLQKHYARPSLHIHHPGSGSVQ